MADRCPHCSFNPTSNNDFCQDHKPVSTVDFRHAVQRMDSRDFTEDAKLDADWALIRRGLRNSGLA